MTLSTTTVRTSYQGSGSPGPFSFPFKIFAAGDLEVWKLDANDTPTQLSYPTQYSVTGVGDGAGGSITLTTALATGEELVIRRAVPETQPASLRTGGTFLPAVHEDALDRATMLVQDQRDAVDRSLKLHSSLNPSDFTTELPQGHSSQVLAWNSAADGFEARTVDTASSVLLPGESRTDGSLTNYLANTAVKSFLSYGAVGDFNLNTKTGTDNYAAWVAATASYSDLSDWRGGALYIPHGRYYFSQTPTLARRMVIFGDGPGFQRETAATLLVVGANTNGFRAYSASPTDAAGPGTSAAYSIIRDLQFYCHTKTSTGHGIHASTQVHLSNVVCNNFAQDGFHIDANHGSIPASGNANGWSLRDCHAIGNGQDGFSITGADANAGIAINCHAHSSGRWGFYENSQLGNTYVACLVESSGVGSYKTTSNASPSQFIGCYVEGAGNYGTEFTTAPIIFGGVLSAESQYPFITFSGGGGSGATAIVNTLNGSGGITGLLVTFGGSGYATPPTVTISGGSGSGASLTAIVSGGRVTGFTINAAGTGYVGDVRTAEFTAEGTTGGTRTSRLRVMNRATTSDRQIDIVLGDRANRAISIYPVGKEASPNIIDLAVWNEGTGCVESMVNGSPTFGGFRLVHDYSTTETAGRSGVIPKGSFMTPLGFWNGSGANARYRAVGTAAPTSGEYAQGDRVDNKDTSATTVSYWECVSSGTPGTWVPRNGPPAKYTKNTTSGATTAASGDLTGADYVTAEYSAVGAANLTTRTATQMFGDWPGGIGGVGNSYVLEILNTSGGTTTLVAGTGVTLTGTMTIAAGASRRFNVKFVSATTVTIQQAS